MYKVSEAPSAVRVTNNFGARQPLTRPRVYYVRIAVPRGQPRGLITCLPCLPSLLLFLSFSCAYARISKTERQRVRERKKKKKNCDVTQLRVFFVPITFILSTSLVYR